MMLRSRVVRVLYDLMKNINILLRGEQKLTAVELGGVHRVCLYVVCTTQELHV